MFIHLVYYISISLIIDIFNIIYPKNYTYNIWLIRKNI